VRLVEQLQPDVALMDVSMAGLNGRAGRGGTRLIDRLTPRQREVLQLIAEGHSTKGIAERLQGSFVPTRRP